MLPASTRLKAPVPRQQHRGWEQVSPRAPRQQGEQGKYFRKSSAWCLPTPLIVHHPLYMGAGAVGSRAEHVVMVCALNTDEGGRGRCCSFTPGPCPLHWLQLSARAMLSS